jgi:dipeptidase E
MKIILTSKAFGDKDATNNILNQINKKVSLLKVLLVATPCLPYSPEKYLNELIGYGFKKDNIIIFNHEEPNEYFDLDIDVVYVTGGNTFTGLKLIKDSGFDKEIIKYIEKGSIYIGRSAGAHIATNSIKHVLEFDSNDVGITDYDGLGLVDCILVCHYNDERKECYNRLIHENKYNIYSLTNQEILIYDGFEIKKI